MSRPAPLLILILMIRPALPTPGPLLVGIRPGSTLPPRAPASLTCSAPRPRPAADPALTWRVNGQPVQEGVTLLEQADRIVSNFVYKPKYGDNTVQCTLKDVSSYDKSAFVFFSVQNSFKLVKLQENEKSASKLWIPFDISNLNAAGAGTGSGEEQQQGGPRDIYQVLRDTAPGAGPVWGVGQQRQSYHHRHRRVGGRGVELLQPIARPLLSSAGRRPAHHLPLLALLAGLLALH